MIAQPYQLFYHKPLLATLLEKRELSLQHIYALPEFGAIVLKEETAVGVGFIRSLEGNMAVFDSFITNPDCSSSERSEALNLITEYLIDLCKIIGMVRILVFSPEHQLVNRSLKYGFTKMPYEFSILTLKEDKCHS